MIENKRKRVGEKVASSEEPLKKKSFKNDGKIKPKFSGKQTKVVQNFSKLNGKGKFDLKTSKTFKKGNDFKSKGGKKLNKEGKGNATSNSEVPAANEKTDWAKFKKEKKELKMKRKKSKDIYEISVEAKNIFEKLRCRKTANKSELVEKLYNLCCSGEDIFKKMVMAHDTARVVQCMLKHSTPSLREQISEKLMPLAVEMSISKYSHFCVLRMFKYGSPTTKSKLVDCFLGNIIKLASHNISSKILDHVYLTVANVQQKAYMRQEFYGDLYKKSKDKNVKCLTDTYKDSTGLKASILGAVKSNLEHMVNKQLVDNSLVHAVMLEYMREVDEDKVEEIVTLFGSVIPLMLTTKDGCQAAIICFYKSTAKNRRAIIKTIKEHLLKICTHEHGHVFILAILNSLDDTKATKKAIYDTIYPELQNLASNQWGRHIINWLINPGSTNCFHPAFIANLDEGLQYGKKDKDVRRKEIFDQIEESIASAITEQPHFWISDRHIGLVTAEILKKLGPTFFVQTCNALAGVIVDPNWTVSIEDKSKEKKPKQAVDFEKIVSDATLSKKKKQKAENLKEKNDVDNDDSDSDDAEKDAASGNSVEMAQTISVPGIEEAGLHIVLKKIIKNDKERVDHETFGSILVQHLTSDTLDYWLTVNRACFLLLNIVKNNNESVANALKNLLESKLSLLKKQNGSGAELLLKEIS